MLIGASTVGVKLPLAKGGAGLGGLDRVGVTVPEGMAEPFGGDPVTVKVLREEGAKLPLGVW